MCLEYQYINFTKHRVSEKIAENREAITKKLSVLLAIEIEDAMLNVTQTSAKTLGGYRLVILTQRANVRGFVCFEPSSQRMVLTKNETFIDLYNGLSYLRITISII